MRSQPALNNTQQGGQNLFSEMSRNKGPDFI